MKRSKRERKFVNSMRAMAEVPWPARRFKYPPTFVAVPAGPMCSAPVTIEWQRRGGKLLGLLRAPKPVHGKCGAPIVLVSKSAIRGSRLTCLACEYRARVGRRIDRIENPPKTAEVFARWHGRRARQAVGRIFSRRKV